MSGELDVPGGVSARRLGSAVRAFFALRLSDAAREACAELVHALRGAPDGDAVRWVRPENLHVTLRFLGNVPTQQVPELLDAVSEALVGQTPFELELSRPAAFPSPRRPRVVAVAVEPAVVLAGLAERVERGVVRAGLPAEKRVFRAHLTLGRVRSRRFPDLAAAGPPSAPPVPVEEVCLMRSDLERSGARYTLLGRLPLGELGRASEAPTRGNEVTPSP